jgi:hypothetical protein
MVVRQAHQSPKLLVSVNLEDALVKARAQLSDEEMESARSSIDGLQKAGIVSVPMLINALGDARRDLSIRLAACSLLSLLGERTAEASVVRVLEEGHYEGLVSEAAKPGSFEAICSRAGMLAGSRISPSE